MSLPDLPALLKHCSKPYRGGVAIALGLSLSILTACSADQPSTPVEPTADLQAHDRHTSSDASVAQLAHSDSSPEEQASMSAVTPADISPSLAEPQDESRLLPLLKSLTGGSLANWKRQLDSVAKSHPRGEQSVAIRRQLLYALEAPSSALFSERIRELPVSVTDVRGASGVQRTYSVKGRPRVTLFVPDRTSRASDAGSTVQDASWTTDELGPEDGAEADEGSWTSRTLPEGPAFFAESLISESVCEYNSAASGYISGDCATTEEIDEIGYVTAAMEYELQMMNDAVMYEGGCDTFDSVSSCEYHEQQQQLYSFSQSSVDWAGTADWSGEFEGEVDFAWASGEAGRAEPCDPGAFVAAESTLVGPRSSRCTNDAIMAAVGVTMWVGSKYAAWAVMTSATAPPVGAVAWAIGGTLTAGWAAASGISSYYNCRRSNQ